MSYSNTKLWNTKESNWKVSQKAGFFANESIPLQAYEVPEKRTSYLRMKTIPRYFLFRDWRWVGLLTRIPPLSTTTSTNWKGLDHYFNQRHSFFILNRNNSKDTKTKLLNKKGYFENVHVKNLGKESPAFSKTAFMSNSQVEWQGLILTDGLTDLIRSTSLTGLLEIRLSISYLSKLSSAGRKLA